WSRVLHLLASSGIKCQRHICQPDWLLKQENSFAGSVRMVPEQEISKRPAPEGWSNPAQNQNCRPAVDHSGGLIGPGSSDGSGGGLSRFGLPKGWGYPFLSCHPCR